MSRTHRTRFLVATAACAAMAMAGCASAVRTVTPKPIAVLDAANGKTISAVVGGTIELTLSSSYWNIAGSSAPRILRQDGQPSLLPRPSGCPGIPGLGCTPERVGFTALAPGTAVISASRTTCGEALKCVNQPTTFRLTVIVRKS